MKLRKIISVFLLLVLCVQLLPLRQTITWLLGGQVTEELVHSDDSGRPGDDLQKHFLPVDSPGLPVSGLSSASILLPFHAEDLPGRHADDIPTPPPDHIG